jgi:hypothetical protein
MNSNFFYTLTLDDIHKDNLKRIIAQIAAIDDSGLEVALSLLPSIYGYLACLLSEAKERMDLAEVELEQQEARLRKEIRETMKKQGAKITEKTLDAEVICSADYIEKRVDFIEATTKYNTMRNLLTTIEYKKDMVIQISANTRNEKKLYTA